MFSTITRGTARRPGHLTGRRPLVAAVLATAFALTACTVGETTNGDDVAADTTTPATSVVQSTEESAPEPAPEDKSGTPDTPVDQLVLNAQDAPELGLVPISAEDISGGMDALSGLSQDMRIEPAECADFNQGAVLEQTEPGVMAIQAGQSDQFPVSVGVTRDIAGIPERTTQIEDCPTMTITMPIQGMEVTAESNNTLLGFEAPEGVEQFTALAQETSMDMMGTPIQSGNVMITGTIRGLGVSVTATGAEGPVPDATRDAAMAAFVKQVDKIRAA